MFRSSVPLGETLAGRSAPERRRDGGDSRPAGGVTLPAPRTLHAPRVAIPLHPLSVPSLCFHIYIPLLV